MSSTFVDKTGEEIEGYRVLGLSYKSKTRGRTWKCRCTECGEEAYFTTSQLNRGNLSPCKCKPNRRTYTRDFTGEMFSSYRVTRYVRSGIRGRVWECTCIYCQKSINVTSHDLLVGEYRKCSCQKGITQ